MSTAAGVGLPRPRPPLKYKGGSASWAAPDTFSPSPIKPLQLERCDSPNKAVPMSPKTSPRATSPGSPSQWSRPGVLAR
jgi:hypothetical protein